jgi:hypothetical protein
LDFAATKLETHYETGDRMSFHDCSTHEQYAHYVDENGSPEAKFVIVF